MRPKSSPLSPRGGGGLAPGSNLVSAYEYLKPIQKKMPASVRGKDSVAHAKWQYAEDQTHNGSASKAILGIEVSLHWWLFATNAQFKFRAKLQKIEVEASG